MPLPGRKTAGQRKKTLRRREGARWLRKNRAALEAYNEHVEKHGVFSDGLRSF